MTNSGVKFSDLNKLNTLVDTDYLLANDNSSGITKRLDVKDLKDHIIAAIPPSVGNPNQDLQDVTDVGSETTNKIEAKGGIDVTGNLKVSDILTLESQASLPTGSLGDVCQFNKEPYFHDGSDWRRFYLYGLPTAPDTPDPDFADVLSRITFNTDFTDSSNSPKTIDSNNVYIDESNTKFGGSSLKVPGVGLNPYVRYDFTNDDLIVGDFSFEMWIYPVSYTTQNIYKHEYRQVPNSTVETLDLNMLSNGTPQLARNGAQLLFSNYAMSVNAWNHILIQRDQSTLSMYLNGSRVSYAGFNDIMYMEDVEFYGNNIWIDDYRLTKDIRYTQYAAGLIEVPTSQLPTSA